MKRIFFIGFITITSILVTLPTNAIYDTGSKINKRTNLKICTDDNFWYPYSYAIKKESKGYHIDIVSKALNDLGYDSKFVAVPWAICLKLAELGKVDAVVSSSYKEDRAKYLTFPMDANRAKISSWRISQVAYYVITSKFDPLGNENNFKFTGNIKYLPKPIRATKGYSIAEDIQTDGATVRAIKSTIGNLKELADSKSGSVITTLESVQKLQTKRNFQEKYVIHARPYKSKSYFMAFSKEAKIPFGEKLAIWKMIVKTADNKEFKNEMARKYQF